MRKKWEWDHIASVGYNIVGKLETTLSNFGILTESEFADIDQTEKFDLNYTSYQWSDDEQRNLRQSEYTTIPTKRYSMFTGGQD